MKKIMAILATLAAAQTALWAQPTITQGPTNQTVALSGTVTLGVGANGTGPLAFQWFKDSRLLVGATNSTLTVTNAGIINSGTYFVVVTNASGMIITQPALVAVGNPALSTWGDNGNGQLGNGTVINASQPVNVASNVVTGAAGALHSLFVKSDATLWAMGNNSGGQLGNGSTVSSTISVNVASNVSAAAAGYAHSLFVKTDGTLWGMGNNILGAIGSRTSGDYVKTPVIVASNVVSVAAGYLFSLFLKNDGTLWALGANTYGNLGNGSTGGHVEIPVFVASNVVAMAAGYGHSLFVKTDGTLWAVGMNRNGQLGNGMSSDANKPISVAGNVVALACGLTHSLFVKMDGTLWAMGGNGNGQLGNGTFTSTNLPICVASNVVAVAAGTSYSLFATADGTQWAMGGGPLGNSSYTTASQPVITPHLSAANIIPADQANHAMSIGVNYYATLALSNLNQIYTGNAISPTASTTPTGLKVNLTFNGSPSAPTNWGAYTVIASISDPNYIGSTTNTLVITSSGPANQLVPLGGILQLSVADDGPAPAYQWFKDSRFLPGATNSTLLVANAGVSNSGTYYVVRSKDGGMFISQPASVTVGNPVLMVCGNNGYGQLGNGTTSNTNLPITVTNNVVAGAAGSGHSLFVTRDGTLWTMGLNQYGQLGSSMSNDTNKPISVAGDVVAVAAGLYHSLYVKTNGTLWAMGNNRYGQLGNGASGLTNATPASVASNVVAVAAGQYHSLFLKSDGTLWTMGNDQYGQMGNGTLNNTNPTPVSVASNVVAIAAGYSHSLFVMADKTLWAMGNNRYGQLGNGTTNNTSVPICVASNVIAVAAGASHSLFVATDGTLWTMGYNRYGQLGNGTTNDTSLPICMGSNVVAVAGGYLHSLFVTTDGGVWAMGNNTSGQLGNGTTIDTNLPVYLEHFSVANVFSADTAGHFFVMGTDYHATVNLSNLNMVYTGTARSVTASTKPAGLAVSLTYNGSLVVPTNWGRYTVIGTINDANYIGSTTNTFLIAPVGPTSQMAAAGGTVTLNVMAGSDQAYQWFKDGRLLVGATNSTLEVANAGLLNSGTYFVVTTNLTGMFISLPAAVAAGNSTLLAWGQNNNGQLGNGTAAAAKWPIIVASNVVTGTASGSHSLFIKTNGTLWAMGANSSGQFGNGSSYGASSPISVASNVVAVAAGQYYSLYVKTNGTLFGMGNNQSGQLGIGPTSGVNLPASVASNVVAVAAGYAHSLFLTMDGTLWAMGLNQNGQLGNGTTSQTNRPISVASNVVAMAAGAYHSLFVTSDGQLWAMGYNTYGQLGNGTTSIAKLPVSVASNVVAVAAGGNHSLFLTMDGTLWAMGYNAYGQLGNGTTGNANLPVSVASNVVAVTGGAGHSLFVTMEGTTWAMGINSYGQLGNGTTISTNLPVNLAHFCVANVFPADEAYHSLAIGVNTQAVATVSLEKLIQPYTGGAINATASTTPAGLTVDLTYNDAADAPTNPGSYAVVGRINDQNYQGIATGTLIILPLKPANQTVAVGGTITLDITLANDPPLSYQWFKDSRRMLGATNSTLTISNANILDSGTYYVVETNANLMRISLPALVVVGNPTLQAWGWNAYGQLGIGTTNDAYFPVTVASNVVTAAAGNVHSLFVTRDGKLWAMGWGGWGQLGNGFYSGTPQTTPIYVASNVVAVAAGYGHSLFVRTDGTLWAMGRNAGYQLGNGDSSRNPQSSPVLITSNVMAVAAGWAYSQYLKTDGTLWIVGNGNITPSIQATNVVILAGGTDGSGLGNAPFVTSDGILRTAAATSVSLGSNVVAAAAGADHSLFVTLDGILWSMGTNSFGQLGNGTTNDSPSPVNVVSNVVSVAAGSGYSMFVITNGTLFAMGANSYGQLGVGTNSNCYNSPIPVPHLACASVLSANTGYHTLAIGINYTANSIYLSDGTPSLTFVGMPGRSHYVKRSTDLINWSVIWTTNAPSNGVFQFADPDAPQARSFYLLQPTP